MKTEVCARAAALLLLALLADRAAAAAATEPAPAPDAKVLKELSARRDRFLERVDAEGYPGCPAPRIVLADIPSFGNYLAKRNEVVVASWSSLSDEERRGFAQLAAALGARATAVSVFEGGTYRWVFMHELGHWWQACRRQTRPNSFEEENGANRIALAFWREEDPRFAHGIVQAFAALVRSAPSPLPAGAALQDYADAHFQQLAQGDTYTWLQAQSVSALAQESPAPSLHKALSQPLFPW